MLGFDTMDWSNALSEPKPLCSIIEALGSLQDQWLYIPEETSNIEFATPCYRLAIDENDLSPEEQDELDTYPKTVGLNCFLCISQLEDIAENIRQQCPSFSEQDLLSAINYYWRHDAFISLATL